MATMASIVFPCPVIWMSECAAHWSLEPLVKGEPEVIKCDAVHIKPFVGGPVYGNQLRREVEYLTELHVLPLLGFGQISVVSPNCLVRNLVFRDVDDRSHKVLVACFVPNAMRKMRLRPSLHCRDHRIRCLMLRSASTLYGRPVRAGVETSASGRHIPPDMIRDAAGLALSNAAT